MSYKHWQLRTLLIPHLHWLTWLDCSAVELCVRPIFPANCGLHSWVLPGTWRVKIRITGCPSHANRASRMPSLAAVTETDDNMNIHEPTGNHRPSKDVSNTYHQQTCNFDKCSCVNFHSQRSGSQPPNLAWKAKGLPGSIATSSLAWKKMTQKLEHQKNSWSSIKFEMDVFAIAGKNCPYFLSPAISMWLKYIFNIHLYTMSSKYFSSVGIQDFAHVDQNCLHPLLLVPLNTSTSVDLRRQPTN